MSSKIARPIGIRTNNNKLAVIFDTSTSYSPTTDGAAPFKRETFYIPRQGVRELSIAFFEGEAERATDPANHYYGERIIFDLPPGIAEGEPVVLEATLNGDGSIAGKVLVRGDVYSYVVSNGTWKGTLLDEINSARERLQDETDSTARSRLEQLIKQGQDTLRSADSSKGRILTEELRKDVDHGSRAAPPDALDDDPALVSLRLPLMIADATCFYGNQWVERLPMVTTPSLREILIEESQLLSVLRMAVTEGHAAISQHAAAAAAYTADRLGGLLRASRLMVPLTYTPLIGDMEDAVHEMSDQRAAYPLTAREREELAKANARHVNGSHTSTPLAVRRECAREIATTLKQMRQTIASDPAAFHAQFQRVRQLTDQYFASQE